jgi:FKBP-type peptidyl-prolyl cis-trans isomerase
MHKRFLALVLILGLALVAAGCQNSEESEPTPTTVWQEMMPGLSYIDSTLGQGEEVGSDDFIKVHYTGWLFEDGKRTTRFDSSRERNTPVEIAIGKSWVIPGLERGIVGMAVGGKRTLKIAPELGFGVEGNPPVIPPGSTLVFDVEVLGVYRVQRTLLEEGTGPEAELGDRIDAHYTGWLWENGAKGEQFDSSHKRNRPHQFTLGAGQVIQGWEFGFEGMKVGTKATLLIPPEMGYGARAKSNIPANSTLFFEVELVEIKGK